jgi:Protein of unknown function (DUF2442)
MTEVLIKQVTFSNDTMTTTFNDGVSVSVPLTQFPRLSSAPKDDRNQWELIGDGEGVHWPKIDEDLSIENILAAYSRSKREQYARASSR